MTQPIESVVRVAASPAQAKIFVAMLQAEGIPARTDGDSLADEFAASRRLMNLLGTKVFVPTASLERAREILQPVAVDPAELEREALATPGEQPTMRSAAPPSEVAAARRSSSIAGLLLMLAIGAAALFAFLWQRAEANRWQGDPAFEYVRDGSTVREVRRRDGRQVRVLHDADFDDAFERIVTLDGDGRVIHTADEYVDGTYTRFAQTLPGDLVATWFDDDADGVFERATVTAREGKVVQTIEWQPGRGYVIKTP